MDYRDRVPSGAVRAWYCVYIQYTQTMHVIRVLIDKEPERYDELMSATINHVQYEGCYVTQYTEYRDSAGRMIGEFMLREVDRPF